jgi:tetraprenyl-beta-curcumene synthase
LRSSRCRAIAWRAWRPTHELREAPHTLRQVWALLTAATRELLWGLPAVSRELDGWRSRAQTIPDAPLRADALGSIAHKRDHAEGAALFWTLPRRRDLRLLALLVAYQTAWDFLDDVSEHGASAGERNGRQLHLALSEALDPSASISDYYRHHPCRHDGGYLRALVHACREGCATLPSYSRVRAPIATGVARCSVQRLNHDPDPQRRDAALREWAAREFPGEQALEWFELTAAASAFTPHPLLALAAQPSCDRDDVARVNGAHFPWVSLAIAMLDSYADRLEDRASGSHSYISHYPSGEAALERLREIVARAAHEARAPRDGPRHVVIVGCMIAMYLSKDSAGTPAMRESSRSLARAGGSLTRLALPIVRAWRVTGVCGQRSRRGDR